jgi:hypothetical protein
MRWFPHHHPSCFCVVCRHDKVGHPSDRCHCERCLEEWGGVINRLGDMPPQHIPAAQWDSVQPHIAALTAAGYYASPVGEIEGDVYVEVEEEAVGMWAQLIGDANAVRH